MKKIILAVALTSLVMTLCSCLSTSCEPSKNNQTLTVGRVIVKFKKIPAGKGGAVLNGDKKGNIELTVRNVDTDKRYLFKTDLQGLFMTTKFTPGDSYIIESFSFNKDFSTGNWAFIDAPLNVDPNIYIEEGYVNPWVDLTIEVWPTEDGEHVRYNYKWNEYTLNEVADDFKAKYPKSKWMNFPFAETIEYEDD